MDDRRLEVREIAGDKDLSSEQLYNNYHQYLDIKDGS